MNLYNELNAYSEEIDVFKIPLSSIDDNCLCTTEQHELQLLKKVSLIYASFAGDGINLCYRISYGDKKVDSDFISKTEQFELREILKKDIPLSIRTVLLLALVCVCIITEELIPYSLGIVSNETLNNEVR